MSLYQTLISRGFVRWNDDVPCHIVVDNETSLFNSFFLFTLYVYVFRFTYIQVNLYVCMNERV